MNLRFLCWIALVVTGFVSLTCAVGAEHSTPSPRPPFHFRKILISDSANRVALLRLPPKGPAIGVDNVPLLATKEFGDYLVKYIGREITQAELGRMVADITDYVHRHGQSIVDVSLPPQNVADGNVRVVVIVGRYNLQRLLISDTEAKAAAMRPGPNDGQIVIQDDPLLGTPAFASAVAAHFGHPITDEALNSIASEIDAYVKARHETLAHIAAPKQNVSTGELRIGVTLGRYPLRRLVLAESPAAAADIVVPAGAGAIVAPGLALFQSRDFRKLVAPYLGQPISRDGIDRLRRDINVYVQKHDRLALSVPEPQVDLASGEVRMAVLIARYGEIQFRGNRWFSSKLLSGELGMKVGDEVRVSELESAVNRANQNPFRHVVVLMNPANTAEPANSDITLDVQEQEELPVRLAETYDDTGNDLLGNNHYTTAVQFGNLFGLDQQLGYQFTTTDVSHLYQAQAANYRIPLPWHDYVLLSGAYSIYNAPLDDDTFNLRGKDVVADARYVHPIFGDTWSLELSLGWDFKEIETSLVYAGFFNAYSAENDIAQFTGGATYVQHDNSGSWVAGINVNGSPGNFNSRNTNASFQGDVLVDPTTGEPIGGPEAEAKYIYETAVFQRLWNLPDDFQFLNRDQAQLSSARLLNSERMSIGGSATVRGYDERIMTGDEGWVLSQEIRSPAWYTHLPLLSKHAQPLATRLLAFWDYGRVYYRHPRPDDIPLGPLMSTGVGIRTNLSTYFSLSADYGWQLLSTPIPQPEHSRGHIQTTLAY